MNEAVGLEAVSCVYGSDPAHLVHAVREVTLGIQRNEFFTLLGPSGCGKTTILRLVAGFEAASSGIVRLGGRDVSALPPFRRPVNTVFQSYALFPHMTVAQNIGFGLKMQGRPRAEIRARVAEMLILVRMEDLAARRTGQISGGQQQRVAIARALAPGPEVLLLDEPLSALDLKLRRAMQIELKRLQKDTGVTFVFVTHDQEEALTMSDRIAVMSGGRVLQVGTPREIYDQPGERFVADFVGEANLMPAEIVVANGTRARVRLDVGAEVLARLPSQAPRAGRVTVVVRPEHVRLTSDSDAAPFAATVASAVFVGTEMHYRLDLSDGGSLQVRRPNEGAASACFEAGSRLGVLIGDDVAQVLRD